MTDLIGLVLLFVGMIAGVLLIPFGFPGAAVVFICVSAYAFITGLEAGIGWPLLGFLGLLTLIAETADNWLTAVGARRFGASAGAMWLSMLGGILGGVFLGIPFSLVLGVFGPLAGGFAGAFIIVFVQEYRTSGNRTAALRAAWGTLIGRFAGMVLKIVIAVSMIVIVALAIVF